MSAQDGPAPELPGGPRPDPRLSPRSLALSEPYPVTLALLQYFYSMSLLTPLQHAPPVLSALLVIATNYNITHLQALVKHAMHRALSNSTSVGVYEVATLCSCRSLQIRYVAFLFSFSVSSNTLIDHRHCFRVFSYTGPSRPLWYADGFFDPLHHRVLI